MRSRVRRHHALAVGAVLGAAVIVLPAGVAHSDGTFTGVASADGVRMTVADPAVIPVGATLGASGPTAQAVVDSLGTSRAYASLPYPGDFAVSVPGLLRGQGASGAPEYPAYAASSSQGPTEAEVATPAGYRLHATSDDTSSAATASAGGASESARVGASTSDASVAVADGVLTVKAEATTEVVEVAGVLRIGRVHASATAVRKAGSDTPELTSSLEVGDMTVAGQTVALTADGLATPGGATPLPDSSPILAVLEDAGITVRYLAPQKTEEGVTSAGMEITLVRETMTTTYGFGRVSAYASGAPEAGAVAVGDTVDPTSSFTSDAPSWSAPAASDLPVLDAPAARPGAPTPSPALRAAFRGPAVDRFSSTSLYLVLVLAALACAGGTQLIRYLGVKFSWN